MPKRPSKPRGARVVYSRAEAHPMRWRGYRAADGASWRGSAPAGGEQQQEQQELTSPPATSILGISHRPGDPRRPYLPRVSLNWKCRRQILCKTK